MTKIRRVIGVGHPFGGDDAVGLQVAEAVRMAPWARGVEVIQTSRPDELGDEVAGADLAIVVDAVLLPNRPGQCVVLDLSALETSSAQFVSSHSMGVPEVLRLHQHLAPERMPKVLHIVGVGIERPSVPSTEQSFQAKAALDNALERIRELLEVEHA